MTSLAVACEVDCPFSAAIEYIDLYHKEHASPVSMPYAHVVRRVQCEACEIRDVTDETRVHEALLFRWESRFATFPPLLHGLVTVRPHGRTTHLRLEASYVPRFGLFGRVIDAMIGRLVVRKTLRAFLRDVRRYVENVYDIERMLHVRETRKLR